ncbi:MAG: beta-ketoacyl synthase N-terminal-like domain-containing protein [Candidatus Tectomicrobia bacterium]
MGHSPATGKAIVNGYSLTTGWGEGLQSLPADAHAAAAGCRVLPVPTPVSTDDRLRRATRECILAVTAVEQALANSSMTRNDLAGTRTALIYASTSAYAAANWAFLIEDKEKAIYFPYTAPSAVPGEVTIQFGITGPYLSFLSGANAGIEALWHAATLLTNDQCDRALVLGVEKFVECEELYTSGRWLLGAPLVEVATCLILERHTALAEAGYSAGNSHDGIEVMALLPNRQTVTAAYLCLPTARDEHHFARQLQKRRPGLPVVELGKRLGNCLACTPLVGLLLAVAERTQPNVLFVSRWWDTWAMLHWPIVVGETNPQAISEVV